MKIPLVIVIIACLYAVGQNTRKEVATNVVFVPAAKLRGDLMRTPETRPGLKELEVLNEKGYSMYAIHRSEPSLAEVHNDYTDIWYVIEGTATITTGGSLTQPTETESGEFRGRGVSGGVERQIAPGDVLRIPNGVPHWISKVSRKELVYVVVKVSGAK